MVGLVIEKEGRVADATAEAVIPFRIGGEV